MNFHLLFTFIKAKIVGFLECANLSFPLPCFFAKGMARNAWNAFVWRFEHIEIDYQIFIVQITSFLPRL